MASHEAIYPYPGGPLPETLWWVAIAVHVQDNKFHCISESDIHQGTNGITHFVSHALGGKTQEAGERNNGDGIHAEDDTGVHAGNQFHGDTDGYKHQQDVQPAVGDDPPSGDKEALEATKLGLVLFRFFVGDLGVGLSS